MGSEALCHPRPGQCEHPIKTVPSTTSCQVSAKSSNEIRKETLYPVSCSELSPSVQYRSLSTQMSKGVFWRTPFQHQGALSPQLSCPFCGEETSSECVSMRVLHRCFSGSCIHSQDYRRAFVETHHTCTRYLRLLTEGMRC